MNLAKAHTFHIPVMGIGFTIDTPVRVAPYGISSVISLVDDILIEKMRKLYCGKFNYDYQPISEKAEDFRAMRITAYLNLIDEIVKEKFRTLKKSFLDKSNGIGKYIEMLPHLSQLKREYKQIVNDKNTKRLTDWLNNRQLIGSIDVNIMTKVDKPNYNKNEKLPIEFNDAHAALRGYAESTLQSSLILSAGMSPRLYGYLENFNCFYPDTNGQLKKKITLKVSDYRSALIQGKFLAKKGLWVSEYRIESGLNCGGHAFATEGLLLGPVLEEFKNNKESLSETIHNLYVDALQNKKRPIPEKTFPLKISAQGGVGTVEEHQFLLDYYQLDSIGWGSPFLLVPDATNVDDTTINKLSLAKEEDLYLSDISPLGVPFNNLKGNTKDIEKKDHIDKGRPGSSCPKKYCSLNTEFSEREICISSRQYQHSKIKELDTKELNPDEYKKEYGKIVGKSCICVGLGTSALLVNNLDTKTEGKGVSICPGPNIAYFSKIVSLENMVAHIYGKINIITRKDRPDMFTKELSLYIDYFRKKTMEMAKPATERQIKKILGFRNSLNEGIEYYKNVFSSTMWNPINKNSDFLNNLELLKKELNIIKIIQGN